uniref:dachshund homolog 2-like isoform X2 n=1 Tax=Monopterus albus TaxID=43700 RepID=UPI0009B4BBCC|nr:dachshund homolog 2-like isoform X2 [Monopterus albus]
MISGGERAPSDPLFHSDVPYSASNAASSSCLPSAPLSGAFLSGRVPARVSGTSGSGGSGAALHTECRMVELHGVKVASFTVNGADLICLPQAFELFLKDLVGGLHTVYTKLKRLDIYPVVCTVEQVRALRGLGAIQPGVNRCKLITRGDFETLYRDCTNASSRPGRPPKWTLGMARMMHSSRPLPHGLLTPALLSQTGLTAAALAEALKLKKMRMMGFHGNSNQQQHHNGADSENTTTGTSEGSWEKEQHLLAPPSSLAASPAGSLHLNTLQQHSSLSASRLLDLPFMVMPHSLLPVGLPPASVAMAMNQLSQLSSLANMANVSQEKFPTGSPSPCLSPSSDELHAQEPTSQSPSRASLASSSSACPALTQEPGQHTQRHTHDHVINEIGCFFFSGLNVSCTDGETAEQENMKKVLWGKDGLLPHSDIRLTYEKLPLTSQPPSINEANPAFAPFLLVDGLSFMETLLTNIEGLLKVAVESACAQDKQNQLERKELKLELERERSTRQTLQRQLSSELQTQGETGQRRETGQRVKASCVSTVSIQRMLKKERKVKRRLQEALDFESRRREQVERALKHSNSLTDAVTPECELENKQQEISATQENRLFTKPLLLF